MNPLDYLSPEQGKNLYNQYVQQDAAEVVNYSRVLSKAKTKLTVTEAQQAANQDAKKVKFYEQAVAECLNEISNAELRLEQAKAFLETSVSEMNSAFPPEAGE